jgi:hypothetical protein
MIARSAASCTLTVALTAALLAVGCSRGLEDLVARPADQKTGSAAGSDQSMPPPPPPPPPPAAANEPTGTKADMAGRQSEPPVEPGAAPPTAGVAGASAARSPFPNPSPPTPLPAGGARGGRLRTASKPQASPPIRLSAGVALAQTLPTGTAMGFSVDYEFTAEEPNPAAPYVWVIEPGKGPPVKFIVRLKGKGNLSMFVPKWRPENGPFQTHIEDPGGRRLSASIPLR